MILYEDTGDLARGPGGWRLLVVVDDARETPRLIKLIHARCWARGRFAYAFVSKGGAVLFRSVADDALCRPTQPDYSCAHLDPGLAKAPDTTVSDNEDGPYLNGASVVLSTEDRLAAEKHSVSKDALPRHAIEPLGGVDPLDLDLGRAARLDVERDAGEAEAVFAELVTVAFDVEIDALAHQPRLVKRHEARAIGDVLNAAGRRQLHERHAAAGLFIDHFDGEILLVGRARIRRQGTSAER